MPHRLTQGLSIGLLFACLGPAPALAQQPEEQPKAGVVTAIKGRATLARPVLPQPVPVKFKDDVFLKDRIDTRENSVVRLLLGGKALITVRELSVFTVTEEPGRAVVDLQLGHLALQVAKQLVKPGESIEIRTPNAVAAVRGSFITVKVHPYTDPTSGREGRRTRVAVVDASLPVTVTPIGAPTAISLTNSQAVTVVGAPGAAPTATPVEVLTPGQVRAEVSTAQVSSDKPVETPQETIATHVTQAEALANVLTESSSQAGTTTSTCCAIQSSPEQTISEADLNATNTTSAASSTTTTSTGFPIVVPSGTLSASSLLTLSGDTTLTTSLLVQSGGSVTTTGDALAIGPFTLTSGTTPLFDLSGGTLTTTGATSDLVSFAGGTLNLGGGLLSQSGGTANIGGDLLHVASTLNGPTTGSVLSVNAGDLIIGGDLVDLAPGSTLKLNGASLASVSGTGTVDVIGGDVLKVANGATVTNSAGAAPVISVTGTDAELTVSGGSSHLLNVAAGGTVDLSGSLLSVSGDGEVEGKAALVDASGTLRLTGMTALIRVNEGELETGNSPNAHLLRVRAGGSVRLKDALLDATNNSEMELGGSVVKVDAGGQLIHELTGPSDTSRPTLVSISDSAVTPPKKHIKSAMFDLTGAATTTPGSPQNANGQTLTLGTDEPLKNFGVLLEASGVREDPGGGTPGIRVKNLVRLDTALLEATLPLLRALNNTVIKSDSDFVALAKNAKLFANLLPADAIITLNASKLVVSGSSLFAVSGGSFLHVIGTLVSLNGGSTLDIQNGGIVSLAGGSVLKLQGSFGAFGSSGTNSIILPTTLGSDYNIDTSLGFAVALRKNQAMISQVSKVGTFTPFTGLSATNTVTTNGIVLVIDDNKSKATLCASSASSC